MSALDEHVDEKYVGALIEATNGESFVRSRVGAEGWVHAADRYVSELIEQGYSVSVIEPASGLPTAYGTYTYKNNLDEAEPLLYTLSEDGWRFFGYSGMKRSIPEMVSRTTPLELVRLIKEEK